MVMYHRTTHMEQVRQEETRILYLNLRHPNNHQEDLTLIQVGQDHHHSHNMELHHLINTQLASHK